MTCSTAVHCPTSALTSIQKCSAAWGVPGTDIVLWHYLCVGGVLGPGPRLPVHCTMCCLYSIFSSQPNEVGHDLTPHNCDIIQHILIPTRSVARKTLLWTFSWASNSKFEIFLELYPCSNYRILAFFTPISVWIHGNSIIPQYHTQGDFGYRGILLYKQHIVHCAVSNIILLVDTSQGERQRGWNLGQTRPDWSELFTAAGVYILPCILLSTATSVS